MAGFTKFMVSVYSFVNIPILNFQKKKIVQIGSDTNFSYIFQHLLLLYMCGRKNN